jgi:hypothetical protein
VSASDGSGSVGTGTLPEVILGAGSAPTTRDEPGDLLTVI